MKIGMRTPSIKRSIKARTTGRIKRSVKSTFNPAYGKKGMGYINDPKKAVYNTIYNKTTTSAYDVADSILGSSDRNNSSSSNSQITSTQPIQEITYWGHVPKYEFHQFKQWITAYSIVAVVAWCVSIGFSVYTADLPYYDFGFPHLFLYAIAVISTGLLLWKIAYAFRVRKAVNQSRVNPLSLSTIIDAKDIMSVYLNSAHKALGKMLNADTQNHVNFFYERAKNAYLSAVNIENLFTYSERTPSQMLEELERAKELMDDLKQMESDK